MQSDQRNPRHPVQVRPTFIRLERKNAASSVPEAAASGASSGER